MLKLWNCFKILEFENSLNSDDILKYTSLLGIEVFLNQYFVQKLSALILCSTKINLDVSQHGSANCSARLMCSPVLSVR